MKLAVLSRQPRSYSTRRLVAAASDRGHEVDILDTLHLAIDLAGGEPEMLYRGRPLDDYDAVIPRIGASITFYGTAVVRQLEQMDIYTPVTATGIANSRDKLRATQLLNRNSIPIPETMFVKDSRDIAQAIERVGGAPVVIKLLEGTQGIGVILAPDVTVAESVIETLTVTQQNVLIQRFVSESRGRDIRAFVVGDRVVAAMRRISKGDEFRSNVHRGGRTEPVELDDRTSRLAVKAARTMDLHLAGVDMLESDDGPLVMEVNSSPGLEGIEGATDLDLAGAVIEYIESQVTFPDLDIRQRLADATGYGVAEIYLGPGTAIIGSTIREGLRDRDITALTLIRGDNVVPNPREDRILEQEDRLLCFGKLTEMKYIIPARRRRRARPKAQPLPADPLPDDSLLDGSPTGNTGASDQTSA